MIVRIRWTPIFGPKSRQASKKPPTRSKLILGVLLLVPGLRVSSIADVPPAPAPRRIAAPVRHLAPEESLAAFMRRKDFAKPYNIREILDASTRASIPPSMIVCIEFVESSGGKYYDAETNNPLGWNNGKTSFPSVHAAIRHVSTELGTGRWYAGKTLEEKLHVYNPRPAYAVKVLNCMGQL